MTSAQGALVNEELVRALNALRFKHVDEWGQALDQIRFRAQGLRRAPPDLLAIKAMIGVLDRDPDAVVASAEAIKEHPAAFDSRMNILRCLSALQLVDDTATFAGSLFNDYPNWHTLAVSGACLCNAGAIDAARELLSPWAAKAEPTSSDMDRRLVSGVWRLLQSLQTAAVTEREFSQAIVECREALANEGWPAADLKISPSIQGGADAPLAIIDFFIDAGEDLERVLEVEWNVLGRVSSKRLFQELKLIVAVLPHEAED
jgi:hypothetical protein